LSRFEPGSASEERVFRPLLPRSTSFGEPGKSSSRHPGRQIKTASRVFVSRQPMSFCALLCAVAARALRSIARSVSELPPLIVPTGMLLYPGFCLLTGINFLALWQSRIYIHLPPTEPIQRCFTLRGSEWSSPAPKNSSARHPKPAFSDNSPFLGDIEIVFLGTAVSAIPTEAAVHLSAPAY
jgi:hypothetical protein